MYISTAARPGARARMRHRSSATTVLSYLTRSAIPATRRAGGPVPQATAAKSATAQNLDRTFRSQAGHAQDHGQGRCCACLRDVPQAGFLHDGRADVWVEEITERSPGRDRD